MDANTITITIKDQMFGSNATFDSFDSLLRFGLFYYCNFLFGFLHFQLLQILHIYCQWFRYNYSVSFCFVSLHWHRSTFYLTCILSNDSEIILWQMNSHQQWIVWRNDFIRCERGRFFFFWIFRTGFVIDLCWRYTNWKIIFYLMTTMMKYQHKYVILLIKE